MRSQYLSMRAIAEVLGRHRSTVYREVARNRSRYDRAYRATPAGEKTNERRRQSRRNQRYGAADFEPIERMLREDLSPQQIVGRRTLEGHTVMSHETIYKWIWADKKRGGHLWRHLRGAPKQRRKRYAAYDSRGRLAGKRMIGERPELVESRSRIGDWEIDTVHGAGKAGVVTVVERHSGVVRIGKIERISMEHTGARLISLLNWDKHRVLTITADNGSEFHGYKRLEKKLGTTFYFATPHHSWERGTNENTNGLIRQYLPKGQDLRGLTQRECTRIAENLNNRPRKRLGFKSPNEVYYSLPVVALQT